MEEEHKKEGAKEEPKKEVSDKTLIISLIVILAVFAIMIGFFFFQKEKPPLTPDDLHDLNLKGKLDPEQGYIYNGYSFIKYDNVWYTKMMSPMHTREYNINFRYGPKETEDIPVYGNLNLTLFNNAKEYYATFDPTGKNLQYVALAISDFNQHMTNIFFKSPIPACDRNETKACSSTAIINCTNTDKLTLYVISANETEVEINNNCIMIKGTDFELVRAVDKVLYKFYSIM